MLACRAPKTAFRIQKTLHNARTAMPSHGHTVRIGRPGASTLAVNRKTKAIRIETMVTASRKIATSSSPPLRS